MKITTMGDLHYVQNRNYQDGSLILKNSQKFVIIFLMSILKISFPLNQTIM